MSGTEPEQQKSPPSKPEPAAGNSPVPDPREDTAPADAGVIGENGAATKQTEASRQEIGKGPVVAELAASKFDELPTIEDAMEDDWAPGERRRWLPLALFFITCGTTFLTGCYQWQLAFIWSYRLEGIWALIKANWVDGLIYMSCVMFVLLCHEMGHFLMTLKHKVHASYPYFIPIPLTITGTMGAVIGMEHSKADRRQLFDIGIAGPLAGLVPTIIFVVIGILYADAGPATGRGYGEPLMVQLLIPMLRPDIPASHEIINPFYMAGWVGMLVTGLNMMPVSQLDGGHVAYAVFGPRWGRTFSRAFVMFVAAYFVFSGNYSWMMMYLLVVLLGIDHPRTYNDRAELGWFRRGLGLASLAIPVFCFIPKPFIGM